MQSDAYPEVHDTRFKNCTQTTSDTACSRPTDAQVRTQQKTERSFSKSKTESVGRTGEVAGQVKLHHRFYFSLNHRKCCLVWHYRTSGLALPRLDAGIAHLSGPWVNTYTEA